MNVALSEGETIVKNWEYGKIKGLIFTKATCTLVVTNKKVINIFEGKKEITREDYDLDSIKSVYCSYMQKGLIFKKGALSLSFDVPLYDNIAVVGMSAIKKKTGFFSRLFGSKRTPKVDIHVAKDIVENISSLILNTKAGV